MLLLKGWPNWMSVGLDPIWLKPFSGKEIGHGSTSQRRREGFPCDEGTPRIASSQHQKPRNSRRKHGLLIPWVWTSSIQTCETIKSCCLSQPWQTKASYKLWFYCNIRSISCPQKHVWICHTLTTVHLGWSSCTYKGQSLHLASWTSLSYYPGLLTSPSN